MPVAEHELRKLEQKTEEMKIKPFLLLTLGAVFWLAGNRAVAQTSEDVLRFSRYNYGFGTARSAAMGGAFSSLGADFSSTVINPAGLGMYRRSEAGLSMSVTSNAAQTTNATDQGVYRTTMDKTKFTLNSGGIVFNAYNDDAVGLTNVTFGITYNKLADFNNPYSVVGRSSGSMIDAFGIQMNGSGIVPPADNGPIRFTADNSLYWGGILAYNTMLLNYDPEAKYAPEGLFPIDGAVFDSRYRSLTKGSVGQYDLSVGLSISHVLYLGLGFGIQDISYREQDYYEEAPLNNNAYGLNHFNYIQYLRQEATAWNFKFGAIVRPVGGLRIGAAIHTPTYVTVYEHYAADMYTYFNDYEPQQDGVQYGEPTRYDMRTPTRFIGGISYTFGQTAIVSVDYERVWYNKMKMFWGEWEEEDVVISEEVAVLYKPANNVRVGVEAMVAPQFFARVGYALYDSMYKGSEWKDYGKTMNYSCGLGYRSGSWSIDMAYIYMDGGKNLPRMVFNETADGLSYQSGVYEVKDTRHNFTLTAAIRF